jgi:hypothetical protein
MCAKIDVHAALAPGRPANWLVAFTLLRPMLGAGWA